MKYHSISEAVRTVDKRIRSKLERFLKRQFFSRYDKSGSLVV